MGKLDDYLGYYNEYRKTYGDKFALFYQIGKFHELYGVDNGTEKLGNVTELANLLNIKETRVDTSILENSRANPQMAGFNSVCLDRNVDLLVDQGYTVLVVNQKPDVTPIEREIAFIASPSTSLNGPSDPYVVSIYIDQIWHKKYGGYLRYIGMAAMDVTTGRSYTAETAGQPDDPARADDDLGRFLQTYAPVEVLLHYPEGIPREAMNGLISSWGYRSAHSTPSTPSTGNTGNAGVIRGDLKPIVYQNIDHVLPAHVETCLGGFYPVQLRGHLNPLDYTGLVAMPKAAHALVYLLRFLQNHNREALNILPPPQLHGDENSLILDTSSLLQLDVLDSFYAQQRRDTVYTHMACRLLTAMGRRLMRERLTNPVTSPAVLNARYAAIALMSCETHIAKTGPVVVASLAPVDAEEVGRTYKYHEYVQRKLANMRDLDRFHRKIALGTLAPAEFYYLDGGYAALAQILADLTPIDATLGRYAAPLAAVRAHYAQVIQLEAAGKCTVLENLQGGPGESIFQTGYNAELDQLNGTIEADQQALATLCETFSSYIGAGSEGCKYREDLEGGGHFTLSKPAWTKFKKNYRPTPAPDGTPIEFADLHVDDRNKSNVKFTVRVIQTFQDRQAKRLSKFRALTTSLFQAFLKSFQPFYPHLSSLTGALAELDLNQGVYRLATEFGYTRPVIPDASPRADGGSFVATEGLRHPVVERRCAYVPQDLSLGGAEQPDGILLYGVNQTGKSCTMKSLGIAVILAQAGFYVPAASFTFWPYANIMTRILSQDNLANGLSTFAVEMVELRSILNRCHKRTLILGDEVCHGTESASAVSLVAAAVIHMANQRSTFIFATHLHELSKIEEITGLPNVAQCHLSVSFQGDQIIYDRYMKPGSGLGRYGIEVAKFLKLPPEVLHTAYTIRNRYYAEPETLVTSRYNSAFVLHKCGICNAPAKDTHHIQFQAESDAQGLIGEARMKKNNPGNLVGLCAEHHAMVHGPGPEELVIFGYQPGGALHYAIRPRLSSLTGRTIVYP